MSVKIRPYKRGGWEVDIQVEMPNGTRIRERKRSPVSSKSASLRWAQAREHELAFSQPDKFRKEIPTLREFAPRFLDGHAKANRQKPSGIASKETILRVHLIPFLGKKKLNEISNEDVQHLKNRLNIKAPKTVNNILTVLNKLLNVALEWNVIDALPCKIRLLRNQAKEASFHDFDDYDRLVETARITEPQSYLVVLLGGDAGLRCGEIMALEWTDIDFSKRRILVQHSEWKGKVTAPKGGRSRRVPMTLRLASALKDNRHLRGPRVLYQTNGQAVTQKVVRNLVMRAAKRANLANVGVHVLRHTFCSHLAMKGAPARAIQELAGHQNLSTTQRYMHLSPAAVEAAISLLEMPSPAKYFGDILETGTPENTNSLS